MACEAFERGGKGLIYGHRFIAGESSTAAIFKFRKDSNSGRSVSAAGTLNASGADYAEYMHKSRPEDVIQKGEVCGVDSNGKLTKRWSEAISFVVKSTDPSYVGGDTWSLRSVPNDGETWDELMALVEIERAKVDRIAFCGQVLCIVSSPFLPGEWVIPTQGEGDAIVAVTIPDSDITFSQYKRAIGQVWSSMSDGKALIAVGLK